MTDRTPAARGGRGSDLLARASVAPITTTALQLQFVTGRYKLPATMAAIVAAHAFGGAHHG